MTDEERQKLCEEIRQFAPDLRYIRQYQACLEAVDELERLTEELRITNKALSMCSDECNKVYERYDKKLDELERLTALAQSDAAADYEKVFTDICDQLGCAYDNEAALFAIDALQKPQSDAEPVRVTDEMVKAASDVLFERTSIAFGGTYMREALEAALNPQQVALYTAPPCPDASAGLIEAAEWHEEQVKKYKEHGGFSMRELELFHSEAADALRARAADRSRK